MASLRVCLGTDGGDSESLGEGEAEGAARFQSRSFDHCTYVPVLSVSECSAGSFPEKTKESLSVRYNIWCYDTSDMPVGFDPRSTDGIKSEKLQRARVLEKIGSFSTQSRGLFERASSPIPGSRRDLEFIYPILLAFQSETKGPAQEAREIQRVLTSRPAAASTSVDRTTALFASIRQVLGNRPGYTRYIIDAIQSLPEDKKGILQHGCPCFGRETQCSSKEYIDEDEGVDENLRAESEDCSDEADEEKKEGEEEEGKRSFGGVDVEPADGESSQDTTSSSQTATSSSGLSKASFGKTTPPKGSRKRGKPKSNEDDEDDEADQDGSKKPNKKARVNKRGAKKHWLCPYCFVCLEPPRSCRPRTAFKEYTDLRRHLERTHRREPGTSVSRRNQPELFMTEDQWARIQDEPEHLKTKYKKNSDEGKEKNLEQFKRLWDILFPSAEFRLMSPFCEDLCGEYSRRTLLESMHTARAMLALENGQVSSVDDFRSTTKEQIEMMMETMEIMENLTASVIANGYVI